MKTAIKVLRTTWALSTWIAIVSANCNCNPCKNVISGPYEGAWNLVTETYDRCGTFCLYQNTDGRKACFCDPGNVTYTEACSAITTASPLGYTCGNTISSDCQAEYNNSKNNNNLAAFYERCKTEGGATPLRDRCSLCCPEIGKSILCIIC